MPNARCDDLYAPPPSASPTSSRYYDLNDTLINQPPTRQQRSYAPLAVPRASSPTTRARQPGGYLWINAQDQHDDLSYEYNQQARRLRNHPELYPPTPSFSPLSVTTSLSPLSHHLKPKPLRHQYHEREPTDASVEVIDRDAAYARSLRSGPPARDHSTAFYSPRSSIALPIPSPLHTQHNHHHISTSPTSSTSPNLVRPQPRYFQPTPSPSASAASASTTTASLPPSQSSPSLPNPYPKRHAKNPYFPPPPPSPTPSSISTAVPQYRYNPSLSDFPLSPSYADPETPDLPPAKPSYALRPDLFASVPPTHHVLGKHDQRPRRSPSPEGGRGGSSDDEVEIKHFPRFSREWFAAKASSSSCSSPPSSKKKRKKRGGEEYKGGFTGDIADECDSDKGEEGKEEEEEEDEVARVKAARIRALEREFGGEKVSNNQKKLDAVKGSGNRVTGVRLEAGEVDEKGNLVVNGRKKRLGLRPPQSSAYPTYALYALTLLSLLAFLVLCIFRPLCCSQTGRSKRMADRGGGPTSMFVPLPMAQGYPMSGRGGGGGGGGKGKWGKKGKGGLGGGEMTVNLVVDSRAFLPPSEGTRKKERGGRRHHHHRRRRNKEGDEWSSGSSSSSSSSFSSDSEPNDDDDARRGRRRRREEEKRRSDPGIDYIGRRLLFDLARKELKKLAWFDAVMAVVWMAVFGLAIGWGTTCKPGGFDGWCNIYNSCLSIACLLSICFCASFVFGVMDLRLKLLVR